MAMRSNLKNRIVVVTRSREENRRLAARLREYGASVIEVPTLRFVPTPPSPETNALIATADVYTHVAFTSPRAVRFFAARLEDSTVAPEGWRRLATAVVGPQTARAALQYGWNPTIESRGGGAALARALAPSGAVEKNTHVLLPVSAIASSDLAETLVSAGAQVTRLIVYETQTEGPDAATALLTHLNAHRAPDAIAFASPSAVSTFLLLTGAPGQAMLADKNVRIVSIGPTTSSAVTAAGHHVDAEAAQPGMDELVQAIATVL